MVATCERFVKASGRDYKCLVDTSRNYVDPKDSIEWCNSNWAGIGEFAASNTGSIAVSRYVWVKPPGESDSECTGQSDQAFRGPAASIFFPENFVQLWGNGVFVKQFGMAPINSTTAAPAATPAATSFEQTAVPAATPATTVTHDIDQNDDTLGQVHAVDQWSDDDD